MKIDKLSALLDDILDDLSARFIINLPDSELSSVTRVCFGLEQAHWFYEDFYRPRHPELPSVNLRAFTSALFSHCPLLWKFSGELESAFDDFLRYKVRVPIRGGILLNSALDKCVLVKGWSKGAGWGFPKGKIDQQEDDAACAVREVFEECGFDVSAYVLPNEFIDVVMKESRMRLYIIPNVPEDTRFEPQTRKEISRIDWFSLDSLPTYAKTGTDAASKNKFYMVAPFMVPLRRWIKRNRRKVVVNPTVPNREDDRPQKLVLEDTEHNENVLHEAPVNDHASVALKLLLGIGNGMHSSEPLQKSGQRSSRSTNEPLRDDTRLSAQQQTTAADAALRGEALGMQASDTSGSLLALLQTGQKNFKATPPGVPAIATSDHGKSLLGLLDPSLGATSQSATQHPNIPSSDRSMPIRVSQRSTAAPAEEQWQSLLSLLRGGSPMQHPPAVNLRTREIQRPKPETGTIKHSSEEPSTVTGSATDALLLDYLQQAVSRM